jgi:hypothetical protein
MASFDADSERAKLILHKKLLAKLYLSNNIDRKKKIESCTIEEIDFLLKFIKVILEGKVPIKREHLKHINQSKSVSKLGKTFQDSQFAFLINSDQSEKIKYLKNIAVFFPFLFHFLFNRHKGKGEA